MRLRLCLCLRLRMRLRLSAYVTSITPSPRLRSLLAHGV